MTAYIYDKKTGEFLRETVTDLDPLETKIQGQNVWLLPAFGTFTPPPDAGEKQAAVWDGETWNLVEDHRQKRGKGGLIIEESGTAYWLPGDTWESPARYVTKLGPLPEGAILAKPEKPAPTLDETKAVKMAAIDAETSSAILAGFDHEIDAGTGTETLHFSYDMFDQQNFADSANVAIMAQSGAKGLPASVTWNAYRDWTPEKGGELVRLTLAPEAFLDLYTGGALTHKAAKMDEGGTRKLAVDAAETAEELLAV